MNRNLPEPGPEVLNSVCVICTSTTDSSRHPTQENGTDVSFSQSTNSLREDDVYPVGILSETFCQFLHLPLNSFKDRFMQEDIFFCKSCALKVQRIHIVLIQLNTLQEELDGFKIDIHKQLEIDQTGNLRNVENVIFNSDAATNCNHGSSSAPTVNLRSDIIRELQLSQISHGRDTVPINISNHEEFIETLSNLNDNNIVENETRVIVTAGTVIDDVFKEEILDSDSNGANDDPFFETEILGFPSAISAIDVAPSNSLKRQVSKKRRKKPQSKNSKRQKRSKPLKRLSSPRIVGLDTSRTLILNLTRVEDEKSFKDINKIADVQGRKRKYKKRDADLATRVVPELKLPTESKRSKPRPKRKTKQRGENMDSEYLSCPNEGCFSKILICNDQPGLAETRLEAHVKKIHQGITKPYKCPECPKAFKHLSEQIGHLRIHTGETPFICEVCGRRCRTQHLLRFHSKIHTSRERTFCCQLCPDKFYDIVSLNAHQVTHTNERPFMCELCPLNFIRKLELQNHQRFIHSKELGLEQCKCRFCGKVFSRKRSLIAHEKSHIQEGEFKCSICEYRSHEKNRVKFHEKQHTLEKIYKCDQCDKAYKHETTLVIHKRMHTGERPFKCKTCGNFYKAKSHLYAHEQTHSGELNHKCSICGEGFVIRKYLLRHEERHKKGKLKRKRNGRGKSTKRVEDELKVPCVEVEDELKVSCVEVEDESKVPCVEVEELEIYPGEVEESVAPAREVEEKTLTTINEDVDKIIEIASSQEEEQGLLTIDANSEIFSLAEVRGAVVDFLCPLRKDNELEI